MKHLAAVTIPVHKPLMDDLEKISLSQCLKVLHKHSIIFYGPASLDTSSYEEFCKGKVEFRYESFPDHFFGSVRSYNDLKLDLSFYYRFYDYKYILTYELDAFVFRDELEYWCNKNYFFIGAPYIFVDLETYPIKFLTKYRKLLRAMKGIGLGFYQYRHVGNGGFSLRHTQKSIQLLTLCNKSAKNWKTLMEDNFFMYWGNLLFPYFNLAPETEAASFSIELDPKETFQHIGSRLPFGCHAFMRYDARFWQKFIEDEGYQLENGERKNAV